MITRLTLAVFSKKKSFKNKYSSIASKQRLPPLLPLQPHLLCPGSVWSLLFCFMSTVSSWVSSSLIYFYLVHFPLHSKEWPFYKTDPAMSPLCLKQDPVCCPQDSCEIQHLASQAFVPPHWAVTCPVSTHDAHPRLTKLWAGRPTSCCFKDALLYLPLPLLLWLDGPLFLPWLLFRFSLPIWTGSNSTS